MATEGHLISLQVGMPKEYPLELHMQGSPSKSWTSGFAKIAVQDKRYLSHSQLEGDGQADRVHHGGDEKAALVYSEQHYESWRQELGHRLQQQGTLHQFGYGGFGENFTVSHWSEENTCIGDVFSLGEALIQVSQTRVPCWKISERWGISDLLEQVRKTGWTGWYVRVLQTGFVQAGDTLKLLERPHPKVTIRVVNDVIHGRNTDTSLMHDIVELSQLAEACRSTIQKRLTALQSR